MKTVQESVETEARKTTAPGLEPNASEKCHCDHFVQFYENDSALVTSVAEFVGEGLQAGEGALVVCTPSHQNAILHKLRSMGIDAARFAQHGQFLALDAQETLSRFMVNGIPNNRLFKQVVGNVIQQVRGSRPGLRVFGEMVALLCDQGNQKGAIQLEELWNELGKNEAFNLFCAYPLSTFQTSGDEEGFAQICRTHRHVLPSHKYFSLNEEDRLREIAVLQQKALSLETEIAKRREAEAKLIFRERELSDFVENASIGLHWVGPDGIIQWANRADFELLGYTAEEFIGRHIEEFHVDKAVIKDILTRLAAGERLREYEAKLRCKDGSIKTVLIDSTVLWDNGRFVHTQCFTRDISKAKVAEEALRTSEDRFRKLVALMPAAVYTCDEKGRITFYNEKAAELWGRSPQLHEEQETFCAAHRCWFHGQVIEPEETPMAIAVRDGVSFRDLEPEFERPDGTKRSVLVNIKPLLGKQGKPAGAMNVFLDITERKEAEKSAALLASIVMHTDDAIFSTDLDRIITSWNKGAERLYGYSAVEVIGKPILTLVPASHYEEEIRLFALCKEGQATENFETVRRRKDGTLFHVSLTISPVRDAQGNIIGISKIARDITERVRAKEKLEQLVTERTQELSEALAQMEEFSYSVSHDLRSPLRAMQGYADELLQEAAPALKEQHVDYLKRISRAASRLDRLTQDVLTFSRLSRKEITIEPVCLARIVDQIVEQYPDLNAIPSSIQIHGTLHSVLGNEALLTQAISNLLNNALKFVEPGKAPQVVVGSDVKDSMVRLWVEDNGIGIEPKHFSRIFQLFGRVHPESKYQGTGIGLAVVKKCVERLRGRVGFEAKETGGSRFWVELPAVATMTCGEANSFSGN